MHSQGSRHSVHGTDDESKVLCTINIATAAIEIFQGSVWDVVTEGEDWVHKGKSNRISKVGWITMRNNSKTNFAMRKHKDSQPSEQWHKEQRSLGSIWRWATHDQW